MGMQIQAGAACAASLRLKALRECLYGGDGRPAPLARVGTQRRGPPPGLAPFPARPPPSLLDFIVCSNGCSSSRRRGLVVAADQTELLYQQGYWASYNLP